jgi:alpha-ketoglutarate-dependent taurine dioxygenase
MTCKLTPGDLVIMNNRRVMHARTGFEDSGQRHLQGCYSDIDGLLSTLSILENQK